MRNFFPYFAVVEIPNSYEIGIISYIDFPPGPLDYVFGRCKLAVHSREQAIQLLEIWNNNPRAHNEVERKFNKELSRFLN